MAKRAARLENPYRRRGKWFKAAFHFHSTNSDGRLSPLEACRLYRKKGYSIIALSDHSFVSRLFPGSLPGTLLLPAAEICWPHLLELGSRHKGRLRNESAAGAIRRMRREGAFPVLCHPRWSNLSWADLRGCAGAGAVEIWNFLCEVENATGYALGDWDLALQSGARLWGTASDDTHFNPWHPLLDGGWTCVRAPVLSRDAVLASLRSGSFYASQGPSLLEAEVGPGEIAVRTSPIVELRAVADGVGSGQVEFSGKPRTSWKIRHGEWGTPPRTYVRLELKDKVGRLAWTNPFFVRK